MAKKIAINGFGRIGRLFFRQMFGRPGVEIVAINDLGDIENLAYLLKHDSVYRGFNQEVGFTKNPDGIGGTLIVGGTKVTVLQEKDATKLPWGAMGIDVVVECTGIFESFEKASVHVKSAGAKHVVISAPAKDEEGIAGGKTILMGANEADLRTCDVSSNGSCTTNATSPVVAVLYENPGIIKAVLNTVHAYTASQTLTDSPVRSGDMRAGRAAAQNLVPHTTGAAKTITRVYKDLQNKFDGVAIRVPVVTGSLTDLTFVAKRKTTVEEIKNIFIEAAASSKWKGILGIADAHSVSSDIIGTPYAVLVDLEHTKVIDGDLVKVLAWYDNEWGYVTTLVQHVLSVG